MKAELKQLLVSIILTIVSPLFCRAEPIEVLTRDLIIRYERPSSKAEPIGKALESEWASIAANILSQIGLAQEKVTSIVPLHRRVVDYARQRNLTENLALLSLISELKTPSTRLARSALLNKLKNKSTVYNLTTALVIRFARPIDIGGAVKKVSDLSPADLKAAGLSDFRVRASGVQLLQYASYDVESNIPTIPDVDPVCSPSSNPRISILDLGFAQEGSSSPTERHSLNHSANPSCLTGAQSERARRGALTHGIVRRICPNCQTIAIEAGCARKDLASVSVVDLAEALVLATIRDSSTALLPLATANSRFPINLSDEFRFVRDADVMVVAAAGDFASTEKHYPAALDGVLGVGALSDLGKPTILSNTGGWVGTSVLGVKQRTSYGPNERRLVSGSSAAMAIVGTRIGLFRATEGEKKIPDLVQAARGGFFSQPNTLACNRPSPQSPPPAPGATPSSAPTRTPTATVPTPASPPTGGGAIPGGNNTDEGSSNLGSPGQTGSANPTITSIEVGRAWLGKVPPGPGSQTIERAVTRQVVNSNTSRDIEKIFKDKAGEVRTARLQILQTREGNACQSLVLRYKNDRQEDAFDVNCPRFNNPAFDLHCKSYSETFLGQQDLPGFKGSFGVRHVCDSPLGYFHPSELVTNKAGTVQIKEIWYHRDSNHPSRAVASFERICSDALVKDRRECFDDNKNFPYDQDVKLYTNTEPSSANIPKNYIPDLVGQFTFTGELKSPGTFTDTTKCLTPNLNGPVGYFYSQSLWLAVGDPRNQSTYKFAASRALAPVSPAPGTSLGGGVSFSIFPYVNSNPYYTTEPLMEFKPMGDRFLQVRVIKNVTLEGGDFRVGFFRLFVTTPTYAYCYLQEMSK